MKLDFLKSHNLSTKMRNLSLNLQQLFVIVCPRTDKSAQHYDRPFFLGLYINLILSMPFQNYYTVIPA